MDYRAHYHRLISRAKQQTPEGYTERHHIVPKCLGGTNDSSNLVRLSAAEHFMAHKLLAKIHPANKSVLTAVFWLSGQPNGGRVHNKAYSWLKHRMSKAMSNRTISDETREKIRMSRIGTKATEATREKLRNKIITEETRAKLIAKLIGRPVSKATRYKNRQSNLGKKRTAEFCEAISIRKTGCKISADHAEKMHAAWRGQKHTEEAKQKMSKASMGKKMSKEACKKMSESHKGKKIPREQVEKIRKANTGKKRSKESIDKMKAAWVLRKMRQAEKSA